MLVGKSQIKHKFWTKIRRLLERVELTGAVHWAVWKSVTQITQIFICVNIWKINVLYCTKNFIVRQIFVCIVAGFGIKSMSCEWLLYLTDGHVCCGLSVCSDQLDVFPVLQNLTTVRRFSMMIMFLSAKDKQGCMSNLSLSDFLVAYEARTSATDNLDSSWNHVCLRTVS